MLEAGSAGFCLNPNSGGGPAPASNPLCPSNALSRPCGEASAQGRRSRLGSHADGMRLPLVRRRRAADGAAHRLMQAPRSHPPKRVVAHSRHQACVAAALSSISATLPSYLCQAEGGCCANRTCSHSGGRSVPVCSLGPIPPIRLLASHSIAVNKLV